MPEDDEYEIIPLSPIRRMEKRIDQLESTRPALDAKEFLHELIDIVKMNQQLVDEIVKANDALRIELSRLPGRIEDMTKSMNEFLSFIKSSAEEEVSGGISSEAFAPLADKLDELIETNKKMVDSNKIVTNLLDGIDRKLSPVRKPLFPIKSLV